MQITHDRKLAENGKNMCVCTREKIKIKVVAEKGKLNNTNAKLS